MTLNRFLKFSKKQDHFPQHFLNFLPLLHQQGSFLPGFFLPDSMAREAGWGLNC